jgi:hypothetical protein
MKGRAKTRSEKLMPYCYWAKATTHEYGMNDNRYFCYGIADSRTDALIHECEKCKAYVNNALPMVEELKRN